MRHYEIVFIVHPAQSEQIPPMLEKYLKMVTDSGGAVHRVENWGRINMAYPIQNIIKANYVCINVECDSCIITDIEDMFKFNDAVMRHLVIKVKKACTSPTAFAKKSEANNATQ